MGGEEIFLGMQEYMKSKEEIGIMPKRYLARNYILRRDLEKKSLNVELQQLVYISAQSTATFIVQMKQNLS